MRSASDAFPHGPPTCLPQKRSRPADGAFSESKLENRIEHAFELYFNLSNKHRAALRSIYEDAKVTEVFDALLNGLTVVGEREPLRVNAALERLLRHLLDESSSPA